MRVKLSYYKVFQKKTVIIEMKKNEIRMNKLVHLGLSKLEL